jgi:hypothetical protein
MPGGGKLRQLWWAIPRYLAGIWRWWWKPRDPMILYDTQWTLCYYMIPRDSMILYDTQGLYDTSNMIHRDSMILYDAHGLHDTLLYPGTQ